MTAPMLRPFVVVTAAALALMLAPRPSRAQATPPRLTDLAANAAAAQRKLETQAAPAPPPTPAASASPAPAPAPPAPGLADAVQSSVAPGGVVLSPRFLADFPRFADLNELARGVAASAAQLRAPGGPAVARRAAGDLAAYRKRLAELADATGSSAALVVSGGVSLGAYQGGFLHYYTQFLLAHSNAVANVYGLRGLTDTGGIRITTGASAGSINAFIAALTRCRAPVADPRLSLFWAAWIPVGFHNLIDLTQVRSDGVLSTAPLDEAIARIGALWTERQQLSSWSQACDAVIGLSATRLQARDIDFSAGAREAGEALRLKRQTEKFVLRLRGEAGRAPLMSPFRALPAPDHNGDTAADTVYPTLGEHALGVTGSLEELTNDFPQVSTLLKASAAFPVAFPPVPVKMTVWRRADGPGFVPVEHGAVRFVDGGVFDNTPIGLALKISGWLRERGDPPPSQLVFLSSDAVGWMRPAGSAQPADGHSLLGTYIPFLGDFVTTAEQNELLNALETASSIPRSVPARMMPIAGEQLSHFFAFAEQDFRVFDFFMGMADAREYLAAQHPAAVEVLSAAIGQHAPARDAQPLVVQAPEFHCFDQHRRIMRAGAIPDVTRIAACASVDANLLALLNASTDLRARAQTSLPAGTGPTIDDFVHAIDARGYKYKQLRYRGSPANADTATLALRDHAQDVVHELGWKQPLLEGYPVWMVGKAAANWFEYRAPEWIWNVGILATGGAEVGLTRLFSPYQRLGVGASLFGRLLRWENRVIAVDGDVMSPVVVTSTVSAAARIEYAVGPALQLALVPGAELDYYSHRRPWLPYFHTYGWAAQAEAILYQRLYLQGGVYGALGDSRSDSDLLLVRAERRTCCNARVGLGLRFF